MPLLVQLIRPTAVRRSQRGQERVLLANAPSPCSEKGIGTMFLGIGSLVAKNKKSIAIKTFS